MLKGANLGAAALFQARLYEANMQYAQIGSAQIQSSDLRNATMDGARIYGVMWRSDFTGASMCGADMCYTFFTESTMISVNFTEANLKYGVFADCDLTNAVFCGEVLAYADLQRAELSGADINHAILTESLLSGAKNVPDIPYACRKTGSFIAYKAVTHGNIAKLEIPADARRVSATGKICRCDKAKALQILNQNGKDAGVREAESIYHPGFCYEVGEIISVPDFDEDRWHECSEGIHFFIEFDDAAKYAAEHMPFR